MRRGLLPAGIIHRAAITAVCVATTAGTAAGQALDVVIRVSAAATRCAASVQEQLVSVSCGPTPVLPMQRFNTWPTLPASNALAGQAGEFPERAPRGDASGASPTQTTGPESRSASEEDVWTYTVLPTPAGPLRIRRSRVNLRSWRLTTHENVQLLELTISW